MGSFFIRSGQRSCILLLVLITLSLSSFAQPLLQKRISVTAHNTPINEVLNQIETRGGFYFSYNSDLLDGYKKVNVQLDNQTVEAILNEVLGPGYRYQVSGNHVIIKLASGQGIIFTGQLIEAETGKPIEYASVYEKSLMAGTVTDEQGNFKLHIRQSLPSYELVISKVSYTDTVLRLQQDLAAEKPITLKRSFAELEGVSVIGVQQHWLAKRLINTKERISSINLNGYFAKQPYQFGILPGLSSKNRLKSQTINKFSFNLIGGYTAGVRGFELGTGFNIVQQDMQYVQIGGLFNIVGGKANGVQFAGIYNYVAKDVEGVQFAGVYNNAANVDGVQATGVVSWARKELHGVQASGIGNKAHSGKGAQLTGFANWVDSTFEGFQAAGAINYNEQLDGVQCAGLLNYTREQTDGVQIAGGINITRKVLNGTQIAGLFNYARIVNGTQLGLINIADTSSGLSLGLINIILKGKHSIDITTTEWQPYSIAYKSGNDRLYNIFQVGGNLNDNQKMMSIGYGIGNAIRLGGKTALVHEATFNTIYAGNWNDQNLMGRYQLMFQYQLHPKLRVYGGPAFSVLYHEQQRSYEGFGVPFASRSLSFDMGHNVKAWIGWTLGFSLF
ncbi:MAG: carboxypeptidase-like regulatory domain-containing protein [Taibaiella sp.]|nr:carboxypeptidase-like regulatory domain-containing protein [Taibaiella sp.]